MDRRHFLSTTLPAAAAVPAALATGFSARATAGQPPADLPRTLVNLMLHGGVDSRFMFMPAPNHGDGDYLDLLWQARRRLYDSSYGNYAEMFSNEYLLVKDPRTDLEFGIHRHCGWLKDQFTSGNVAVVANAYCSRNRRHDQSILNADTGEPDSEVFTHDRDGWGGRLVEALGGNSASVELASTVSTFNKSSDAHDRLARVVHAQQVRELSLPRASGSNRGSERNVLARAMRAYYTGRGSEIEMRKPSNWVYRRFFDHFNAIEALGQAVAERMADRGPLPPALADLDVGGRGWAQQCRNLYDVCQVHDLLGARCLSMSYGGWDTHDKQRPAIGANLEAVFGAAGGLAVASNEIDALAFKNVPARENLVIYASSDFGRQLHANGSNGTDHGSGLYAVLIGAQVAGGVYGEMFPERETRPDDKEQIPLETEGAEIFGQTSTNHLLASMSDWMGRNAARDVVPDASSSDIEDGVSLEGLLPRA